MLGSLCMYGHPQVNLNGRDTFLLSRGYGS